MFSEKLITLLQSFSKYNLNQFRKFLQSPYFNEQEDVLRLFDLWNAALRKGPSAVHQLDKALVWRRLYPGQAVDEAHLRRLASELTQLALKFLAQEKREAHPPAEWLDLQEALEKPELAKHLAGVERQFERFWETHTEKSAAFYLINFRLHWNIFNRASKVVATTDYMDKLLPADYYLECFYVVQKLKLYVSWLLFRGFRSTGHDIPVQPGFWEYLRDPRFGDLPLVEIFQNVIRCLTAPEDEGHFRALMLSLERRGSELSHEDLRECYHIAQNYCALKINQGKMEYYREMFEIFRMTITRSILLEDGQLSEGVYKNVVTVSLGVGEYAWAEHFIETYSVHLPASLRDNARRFGLSNLFFHQKKYAQVIELLSNMEYSDVVYALGAKLLLLRTYYEAGEYLAMDSLIDSFRIFLRRNKVLSKEVKREYNNFLNFLKKLASLPVSQDEALVQFRKRVGETQHVVTKKWLLEKVDELRAR